MRVDHDRAGTDDSRYEYPKDSETPGNPFVEWLLEDDGRVGFVPFERNWVHPDVKQFLQL